MILRRTVAALLVLIFALAASAPAATDDAQVIIRLKGRAQGFVQSLMAGNAHSVQGEMTRSLRRSLSQRSAQVVFDDLIRRGGGLQSIEPAVLQRTEGRDEVTALVPIHMRTNSVAAQVVFERFGPLAKITSFSVLPWEEAEAAGLSTPAGALAQETAAPPPAYAEPHTFREVEIPLETPSGNLRGVLTLPIIASETNKVPAVVLLPGMGGFDADATLGQAKPFRDIAQGLATRGVAVYRFETRDRAFPEEFLPGEDYDLEAMRLDDARAAMRLVQDQPRIDAGRVFLAGHNLGGFLAPGLARVTGAAGTILLAPIAVPVSDYLIAQAQAFLDASPGMPEEQRALFEAGRTDAERLAAGTFTSGEMLFNIRGAVWKDLQAMNPVAQLGAANRPFLIAFAGRDFLVRPESHTAWRAALDAQEMQGAITVLPGLNHAFVRTDEETPTPESPFARGNVDEALIIMLSDFVKKGRLPQ